MWREIAVQICGIVRNYRCRNYVCFVCALLETVGASKLSPSVGEQAKQDFTRRPVVAGGTRIVPYRAGSERERREPLWTRRNKRVRRSSCVAGSLGTKF